uniref:Uncharacterized protein n=1 Tax=Ananas comosus var. bracteatus TaxID=296719 RepID=A0A6V7NT54_ANACO|nr:unnamed protein product [Ananas comosus var. bracteatus]
MLLMLADAVYGVVASSSPAVDLLSAALMGASKGALWMQSGFLDHDSGHYNVLLTPALNRLVQVVAGNCMAGISTHAAVHRVRQALRVVAVGLLRDALDTGLFSVMAGLVTSPAFYGTPSTPASSPTWPDLSPLTRCSLCVHNEHRFFKRGFLLVYSPSGSSRCISLATSGSLIPHDEDDSMLQLQAAGEVRRLHRASHGVGPGCGSQGGARAGGGGPSRREGAAERPAVVPRQLWIGGGRAAECADDWCATAGGFADVNSELSAAGTFVDTC